LAIGVIRLIIFFVLFFYFGIVVLGEGNWVGVGFGELAGYFFDKFSGDIVLAHFIGCF
jgi:hypothetical protein